LTDDDVESLGDKPTKSLNSFLDHFISLAAYLIVHQAFPTIRLNLLDAKKDIDLAELQDEVDIILEDIVFPSKRFSEFRKMQLKRNWEFARIAKVSYSVCFLTTASAQSD
jgi:hypothetical protein